MEEYPNRNFTYNPYQEKPKKRFHFRFPGLASNKPYVNLILLLFTILSTYLTGGAWYSFSIIVILFSHEMGHYLMCRRYRVPATLPYFIPFPFGNPFGTMGAVIQMKGYIPSKKALFDIGAAGPLAGFVFAVPAVYIGILHSTVIDTSHIQSAGFLLGESLLFKSISYVALGPIPEGYDIVLHPMAYAGWAGLFVTALNLLPIGQLDGGHIIYSIFGKRQTKKITLVFLGTLGILSIIYPGWALLFILLVIFGRKHPAPLDDYTPLDRKRKIIGAIMILIFITSFTPIPFKF